MRQAAVGRRAAQATSLAAALLLAACTISLGQASKEEPADTIRIGDREVAGMTLEELRSANMSYADRFTTEITGSLQAMGRGGGGTVRTPEARRHGLRQVVFAGAAAYQSAAQASPVAGMFDLVVLTFLTRTLWEEYWAPSVYGEEAAAPMLRTLRSLDKMAWDGAGKILTPAQLVEMREMLLTWRRDNPDILFVSHIRFSEFGDLTTKPNLSRIESGDGLLAQVDEAMAQVDEVRIALERATYLATRMQLIAGVQLQLLSQEIALQPEVERLLDDITALKSIPERTGEQVDKVAQDLVNRIAEERRQLIEHVAGVIAEERERTIRDAARELARERDATIRQATQALGQQRAALLEDVARRVATARVETLDQGFARLETFQEQLLEDTSQRVAVERGAILGTTDDMIEGHRQEIVEDLNSFRVETAEDLRNTVAFFLAGLGGLLVLAFLLALVYRLMTRASRR